MISAKNIRDAFPKSMQPKLVPIARRLFAGNLDLLARLYHTDKWGVHWYTQHYQRYFAPLRQQRIQLLEIGVGGYDDSAQGGSSLRMWKAFFPKARIVGIDLHDKTHMSEPRIEIRQCDQTDAEKLRQINAEYGGFDIIIDDGSHLNEHVIKTFGILFPLLRQGGIYSIEDTQTSYWPSWGGGIDNPDSMINFVKRLVDGLNHVEYPIREYAPSYFDKNIVEIAFFHNLIIIRKAKYEEASNCPEMIEEEMQKTRA